MRPFGLLLGSAITLFAVAAGPVSGSAEEAKALDFSVGTSFDCFEAKTTLERLICSDPVLVALDGALGEAVSAAKVGKKASFSLKEHRAWLKSRAGECAVPENGAFAGTEARTRSILCLIDLYDKWLKVLDAPVLLPVTALPPDDIHPLCVVGDSGLFEEGLPAQIRLAECQAARAHVPVERRSNGLLGSNMVQDGVRGWVGYRLIGSLSDGREGILAYYNGGGSGLFSIIATLRRERQEGEEYLSLEALITGGDRCNGGIVDAVIKEDRVIVDVSQTPSDVALSLGLTKEDQVDDLSFSAVSCFAEAHFDRAISESETISGSSETDSFSLDAARIASWADDAESQADRCLFQAVLGRKHGNEETFTIPKTDFEAVAEQYRLCLKVL